MRRGLSMSRRFVEDEARVVCLSHGGSVSVIRKLRMWILDRWKLLSSGAYGRKRRWMKEERRSAWEATRIIGGVVGKVKQRGFGFHGGNGVGRWTVCGV